MTDSLRISYNTLCQRLAQRLHEAGIPQQHAIVEAGIMAEADLQEVPSHGVRMLPGLLTALADGRVKAAPLFSIEREMGAICVLDCGNGPGRYAAHLAMEQAKNRAREFGVGVCLAKKPLTGDAHMLTRAVQRKQALLAFVPPMRYQAWRLRGQKKPLLATTPLR